DSPGAVEDCLRLKIGTRQYEVFIAVYLDARNRLIDMEEIARGSLTRMAVYPREIVRRAMKHNAAALIVAHDADVDAEGRAVPLSRLLATAPRTDRKSV
ncbi:hypothetical protein MAQ58_24305, partial [Enterobacter sp. DRP3]|nr:hypothetical protein [Enterobacter sp. DRP3]